MIEHRSNHPMPDHEPAPFQRTRGFPNKPATIPWAVHMRAYEVYCVVFAPQPALVDLDGRNCRGGFGTGELIAFLYASGFPREEWRQRFDEAINGMQT